MIENDHHIMLLAQYVPETGAWRKCSVIFALCQICRCTISWNIV